MSTTLLVNIDVDDLHKGTDFYTKAFGLTIGRRFGARRGRAARRDLADLPARQAERHGRLGDQPPPALVRAALDADAPGHRRRAKSKARVDRARNAGARLEGPVKSNNWGKIAMLADPFGHGICLIEFVGRGYDEIATEKADRPHRRAQLTRMIACRSSSAGNAVRRSRT